jgi:hypothetical protein
VKSGGSPMQRVLSEALFLGVCLIFLFHLGGTVASQKRDYLTEEEIEQLREAQEPPLRMNILIGILNNRFEKVRTATPSSMSAKEEVNEKDRESKRASQKPTDTKASPPNSKERSKKQPPETLVEILNDYLSCVDEVSANVENSRSLPLDPKEFLRSLNKLDGFLQKQNQLMEDIQRIKDAKKAKDKKE